MAAPFGFSVGDFITTLELVGTVIDALRDSGQVTSQYRELLRQLYALETALLRVKRLDVEDAPVSEVAGLREAASQCQCTIDDFWHKLRPYEASMMRSPSGVRDKWAKIKWSVCHKDDIRNFKADLVGHTEAILLLLNTVQMGSMAIQQRNQKTLSGRIQTSYFQCMAKLSTIYTTVHEGVAQGKELLSMTTTILRTNVQVFQAVIRIHDAVTSIPGQIERQQPVFLIDALGKTSPFHLEFIRSAEAFKSVLQVNFREVGAEEKIEKNEFVIEDIATRTGIDLSREWGTVFVPGQRVEMSMIFVESSGHLTRCPKCTSGNDQWGVEIECQLCGLIFRRIKPSPPQPSRMIELDNLSPPISEDKKARHAPRLPPKLKRKRAESEARLEKFRKVRLRYDGSYMKRAKLYILRNNDWKDLGTGFCYGVVRAGAAYLELIDEDVENKKLLQLKIHEADGFQKQQETLIVWIDAEVNEWALSFQEAQGCSDICNFISKVPVSSGSLLKMPMDEPYLAEVEEAFSEFQEDLISSSTL